MLLFMQIYEYIDAFWLAFGLYLITYRIKSCFIIIGYALVGFLYYPSFTLCWACVSHPQDHPKY